MEFLAAEWLWILLATLVALASFFLSFLSFMRSRRVDKRDLLLHMHRELTRSDVQEGRRLLLERCRPGREVQSISNVEKSKINHALSQFDILGFYCESGYIKSRDSLALWAAPLIRVEPSSQIYMEIRRKEEDPPIGVPLWPHLRWIQSAAREYLRPQLKG